MNIHSHAQLLTKHSNKNLPLLKVSGFTSFPGKGVIGIIDGKKIAIGNKKLMQDVHIQNVHSTLDQDALFYSEDGSLIGTFIVSDSIKKTTPEAIQELHKKHIRVVMLTGDNKTTANSVAKTLGIDEVYAEVSPEDKNKIIKMLQNEGRIVAMAGDGINDAPALASANVGIAMGTGSDIAIDTATITLVKGDLMGIVKAISLSQATVTNIRQNLCFAFLYNSLGVPIAAGVLYPYFGILLSPIIASGAMALSSLSVVWNALRLRFTKL